MRGSGWRVGLLAAGLLAAGTVPARGDWQDEGIDALRMGNYAAAADVARSRLRQGGVDAEVLQFGAHVLQWSRGRDRNAAVRVKTDYPALASRVSLGDVPLLERLVEIGDPALTKYASALLDEAAGRVASPDQARRVPEILAALPPDKRPKVIGGLYAWLAAERAKVDQGRTLTPEVRDAFADPELIRALARELTAEPSTREKALSLLPAKFQAAVTPLVAGSGARDCLVQIEEPALAVLESLRGELGPAVETVLADIRVAKSTREIRHPGSTWYSGSPP